MVTVPSGLSSVVLRSMPLASRSSQTSAAPDPTVVPLESVAVVSVNVMLPKFATGTSLNGLMIHSAFCWHRGEAGSESCCVIDCPDVRLVIVTVPAVLEVAATETRTVSPVLNEIPSTS
jgi:hypothetical protein